MTDYIMKKTGYTTYGLFLSILIALVSLPAGASGSDWQVSPIRLDFNKEVRTGSVTVFNGGDTELRFQIKAYEWTQDPEGKDRYEETSDLHFYPKMMTLGARSKKVIRTGVRQAGGENEKTYRLFIQEIPGTLKEGAIGVSVALRFGVPVFVAPAQPNALLSFGNTAVTKDGIQILVRNIGNVNVAIDRIVFSGLDSFGSQQYSGEANGWYLLHGSARLYTFSAPGISCHTVKKIIISAKTDKRTFEKTFDTSEGMCVD